MSNRPEPQSEPVAMGADTLVGVLRQASDNGFATQFTARPDGSVVCESCGEASPASAIDTVREHRLEGASDAADMMLVVEASCPACETGGVLTLGYGPNATEEDHAVLDALESGRD